MAKKNRTGLQSEVSHIFAGVPIPKKKRPPTDEPEQKPESKDTRQTPAQQIPAKEQPATTETPPEQPSVTEFPAEKPSTQQVPEKQKQAEETPVKEKPEIKPQAEEPVFKQPPLTQLPEEQPSIPFSQTIELPEIDEPAEAILGSSTIRPVKAGVAGKSGEKIPRKASARSKNKRFASKSGTKSNSRKQTTMVILVIALSILLFFLLFKPFNRSSYTITDPGVVRPAAIKSSAQANAASVLIKWQIPEPYPANIRDPMLMSSQQQFYSETWKPNLVGLVYNEIQKYAIIGTDILQEGEEVNGVKIIKINKDSVEFERNGQKWKQEVQSENN